MTIYLQSIQRVFVQTIVQDSPIYLFKRANYKKKILSNLFFYFEGNSHRRTKIMVEQNFQNYFEALVVLSII